MILSTSLFPRIHRTRLSSAIAGLALAVVLAGCGGASVLTGDASYQGTDEAGSVAATEPTAETATTGAVETAEPADTETVEATATTPPESTAAQPAATTPPAPTPAVAPPPSDLGAVVASGGAFGARNDVQFSVGRSIATTLSINEIATGEPDESDGLERVVVELGIEALSTNDWTSSVREYVFELHSPDGTIRTAEEVLDHVGETVYRLDLGPRGYRTVRAIFEVDGAEIAASDLHVADEDGETVPLVLPLEGPGYFDEYPLTLPSGATAEFNSGAWLGCDGGVDAASVVERATVGLEGGERWTNRVRPDERILTVELAVSNLSLTDGVGVASLTCEHVFQWAPFLISIDGRIDKPFDDPSNEIAFGATGQVVLEFAIPASASRVDLLSGIDETKIGGWDLALPAAVGEAGATRVRTSSPLVTPAIADPIPTTLETISIGTSGATGTMLFVTANLGETVATTSDPESYVSNRPEIDEDGRAWVIAAVGLQGDSGADWRLGTENFVLEDPNGRSYKAAEIFGRDGSSESSVHVDGRDFSDLRVAFETESLITTGEGWSISLESGSVRPVTLPFDGTTITDPFPVALTPGASRTIRSDSQLSCPDAELSAEVIGARIDIEGRGYISRQRALPSTQLVVIDLALTNPLPANTTGLLAISCGALGGWPEFLLRADGLPTQSLRGSSDSIGPGDTETIEFVFEIPADTQTIGLWGGVDPTLIAGWEVKDNAEVLSDFGAEVVEDRTLVTIGEQVLFAFGESTLQQAATPPLTRLATVLSSGSTGEITITGHTDSIGDEASNQTLSLERAQAVADFLAEAGVDVDRLAVTGAGEASPVAANENADGSDNPEGRAQNRRVEILFTEN